MALIYKRFGIDLTVGAGTDVKVKVSLDDTNSGFLEEKVVVGSNKLTIQTLNPAANEQLELDVDETNIDHDQLLNYEVNEHRPLDDALTSTTNLWSADKIQTELDGKINAIPDPVSDNLLTKTIGLDGNDLETTGISVDDSNNITGVNDLVVAGDLTVNGTEFIANVDTIDVEDPNIGLNRNGTQATANAQKAGLTVQMTDATDAIVGYDSTLTSKFKLGEDGDEREVVTTTHIQSVTNKTINADNNTISELEVDNFKAGVIDTDMDTGPNTNTSVPTTLAVETYIANNVVSDTFTVKVSTDDTTPEFLEDKLSSGDSSISITTTNPAGDEGLDLQVNEANVDHDALLNYVANEHVDHSSVLLNTNADSGLTGGGDLTASRTLSVDINGTTEELAPAGNDEILVHDTSAGALKKMTRDTFLTGVALESNGDINETSFATANNVAVATDVTGFAFNNAQVRSFKALVSIEIDATADLFETREYIGIQKGSGWEMSPSSVGDDSGIDLTITSTGQVQYTSSNVAGFSSGAIKFRAITTSI